LLSKPMSVLAPSLGISLFRNAAAEQIPRPYSHPKKPTPGFSGTPVARRRKRSLAYGTSE